MIDLTIKTLDSQNRAFTVPEDYTVRQLKEHITEAVSIAPDVQRLIYCGRVLVDEHKLSQYNVHGKVIHLVERAPPSTSRGDPDGGSSTGDQGAPGGGFGNLPRWQFVSGGGGPRGRRGRGQDNTMYLGAMAFPADLMDARGISMPQPRPCLTRSRLLVARSMLNTASRTLARLENPRSASSEPTTATAEPSSSQESVVESPTPTPDVTSRRNSTSDTQSEDNDESNLELATQAATAAALVSAVLDEAVAHNTSNQQTEETIDITIEEVESSGANTGAVSSGPTEDLSMMEDAESPISPIVLSPSCPETPREQESPPSMETEPEPTLPGTSAPPPEQPPTNTTSTQPAADASAQHQRGQPARPQCMAAIVGQLNELNRRLEPFMNQYYNLLQADPNYETSGESNEQGTSGESPSTSDVSPSPSGSTTTATNSVGQTASSTSTAAAPSGDYPHTAAEADLLFRSISEIMHALSHSYHALSDIVCSFSRQPGQGRVLRCRPVLIQHSAVLHAPVPVIVERAAQSISLDRNRQGTQQQQQSATTGGTGVPSASASSNTPDQQPTAAASGAAAAAASVNNGGARFQISPNNLDIFMEMGPTITIDSVEATILPRPNTSGTTPASGTGTATPSAATGTGTAAASTGNVPAGQFPWGTPPPPEFIQNLPTVTPPEFIQNLVQSISERIGDVGEANIHIAFPGTGGTLIASTVPPVVPPAPAQAPPQPGQQAGSAAATTGTTSPTGGPRAPESTQARVNTQTHPTTSTQTRSTSRPQIHLARTIQNHLRTFDPFLPCNSHHIRNRRNGSTRSGSNTNTSQSAWQSNNNNNNNNNGATASTGATNVRSTPSGVTAEFNMPATAPFRNIVESILSHSLENISQGGAGGLGPNIVALGPGATFGPGGTANISFEIGRVTPLTVNTAGLASMMGAAAGAAMGAAAGSAAARATSGVPTGQNQGNANPSAPPRGDVPNMDSPQSPPLAHQGLPQGGANAGGGFLASLFGQLGNLLPHAGNSDLLGGMRNAGGTTNNNPANHGPVDGAGGANNRPWVEIASSGGGTIGSPDFINFLQNIAAQNTNMPFYQPQQSHGQSQQQSAPVPSAPPAPSVSPLLPLVRRLLLDQQDSVTDHMTSSLAQFLGLTLRTPLSGSSEFLPDLLFTVLSTVTLGDILSFPSTSNPPVDHSMFNQFVERHFGPGGIGVRFHPSHYLNILEVEMERYFNNLSNVLPRVVDDIDLARSLSRLNSHLLEPCIRLMDNTTGPQFRSRFLDSLKAYFQNLVCLLIRCFIDSTFVTTLLRTIVQREIAQCQASAMTGESTSPSSSSFSSYHPHRVSLLIQMIPNLVQLVSSQFLPVTRYLVFRDPLLRPPRAGITPQ
ncbi:hypothetical protein WDU94_001214, partial [Cyamophila willieti]